MRLEIGDCFVRSWRAEDAAGIVVHANNINVARNLRDGFPHPYTIDDARSFIEKALATDDRFLCIADAADIPIGGVGYAPMADVHRFTAEIGYWLGEAWWGRGIATAALTTVTELAFSRGVKRLEASVYEWNPASRRVLEKCGYECEARLKQNVFKQGRFLDSFLYARLAP